MTGAGPSPLGAGSPGLAPAARGAPRLDGGGQPRAQAPASGPAARGDRGTVGDASARARDPASDQASGERPFAALLDPAPPSPSPSTATPGEAADGGEDTDDTATSPQHLLALLDGPWVGARAAPVAVDGACAVPVPTHPAWRPLDMAASAAAPFTSAVAGHPTLQGATPTAPGAAAGASPAATGANAAEGAAIAGTQFRLATDVAAPSLMILPATAEAAARTRDAGGATDPGFTIEAPTAGMGGTAAPGGARPQAAAALPPLPMPPHPDAGFDDGFGQRIAWMADQRVGHAEIRLNPEHVGPIDVRVQLDGDKVRAEFHSAHAEVRQAIEASLPRLRELLGQHGLQLGQADVGQRQPGQDGSTPRGGATARAGGEAGNDAPPSAQAHVRLRGLLDEYA